MPTPPQVSLPWPYTWDRILGQAVTGVLWVAGLTWRPGSHAFNRPIIKGKNAMQVQPYLFFNGRCEEAVEFSVAPPAQKCKC